jgi:hypothetical protein
VVDVLIVIGCVAAVAFAVLGAARSARRPAAPPAGDDVAESRPTE